MWTRVWNALFLHLKQGVSSLLELKSVEQQAMMVLSCDRQRLFGGRIEFLRVRDVPSAGVRRYALRYSCVTGCAGWRNNIWRPGWRDRKNLHRIFQFQTNDETRALKCQEKQKNKRHGIDSERSGRPEPNQQRGFHPIDSLCHEEPFHR